MAEHLLIFEDRETAEEVADELIGRGHSEVRVVREALAGEDDSEDHEWAVDVRLDDSSAAAAEQSARAATEFATLATEHGGWYDAPNG